MKRVGGGRKLNSFLLALTSGVHPIRQSVSIVQIDPYGLARKEGQFGKVVRLFRMFGLCFTRPCMPVQREWVLFLEAFENGPYF